MYGENIKTILQNLKYAGGLQGSNAVGKYTDPECGDCVKLYLKVNENQQITEAKFKTMGQSGTIVASNCLCEILIGKKINKLTEVTKDDILEVSGEYPEDKEFTIQIVLEALKNATFDYYAKIAKQNSSKSKAKETKTEVKKVETVEKTEKLDSADKFILEASKKAEVQAQENLENREKVTIIKETTETENITATYQKNTQYVDNNGNVQETVNTKQISKTSDGNEVKTVEQTETKQISKAKAMFDAMFEE